MSGSAASRETILMNAESTESNYDGSWNACAPGSLQAYGRRCKALQRRQVISRAAGTVVVLLCVGLGMWAVNYWSGQCEYYFGGIACSEVRENLDAYAMGTLPEPVAEQMQTHLHACPRCQRLMHDIQQMQASAAPVPAAGPSRPHCRPRHERAAPISQVLAMMPKLLWQVRPHSKHLCGR